MRALFIPSNASQMKVLGPVADLIAHERGEVFFLSLENYNTQPRNTALIQQLESEITRHNPDVVILANSLGELEQLAIRSANRLRCPTVLIQDEMFAQLDVKEENKILPSVLSGPVDLICVWNEHIKEKIRSSRSIRRLIAAGAPCYDHLGNTPKRPAAIAPYTVLVATQDYAISKINSAASEIALYERVVNRLLSRSDIGKIIIKPPLQSKVISCYRELAQRLGTRVAVIEEGETIDLISSVNCVLSTDSEILAQACLLGAAVVDLSYLNKQNELFLEFDEKFDQWISNSSFPADFFSCQMQDRQEFIERICYKVDGLASRRIVDAIRDLVACWKNPTTAAKLTVITELHLTDPLLPLNIILSNESLEVAVIAIDRSANGTQKALVESILQDERLSILHLPADTSAQAFCKAIAQAKTDGLILLGKQCLLQPGAVEFAIGAFKDFPELNTFLGSVSHLEPEGIAPYIVTRPRENSFAAFSADPLAAAFAQALFVRKNALPNNLPSEAPENQFPLQLLELLTQNAKDKKLIITRVALSLYPYSTAVSHQATYQTLKAPTTPNKTATAVTFTTSSTAPEISVLLCSFNREAKVGRCLEALAQQSIDKSRYEVICVNDGSTDKTGIHMQAGLKELNGAYLEHETNKALAAARNTALGAAKGKYVLFINDDTYATPTFLEQHLKTHQQYAGKDIAVAGYLPFIEAYKNRVFSLALMDANLYFGYSGLPTNQPLPFWFFITGNLSVPRHLFEQNNVRFNETFIRYGYEDIECGYRLWQKGLNVYYNPEAQAIHDHLMTIQNFITREEHNAANILQFCVMHPDPILAENLITTKRLTEATLKQWTDFVEGSRPRIPEIVSQIASVQELVADMNSPESRAKAQHLIKEVGESTRLVAIYTKISTFLEVFKEHPELKRALLSDDWERKAQQKYAELGYSAMI